jgi:hypothetical protein
MTRSNARGRGLEGGCGVGVYRGVGCGRGVAMACVNDDLFMWPGPTDTGFEVTEGFSVANSAREIAIDSRTRMIVRRQLENPSSPTGIRPAVAGLRWIEGLWRGCPLCEVDFSFIGVHQAGLNLFMDVLRRIPDYVSRKMHEPEEPQVRLCQGSGATGASDITDISQPGLTTNGH